MSTSDILYEFSLVTVHQSLIVLLRNEIPEMIACVEPLNAGFALSDPEDPRHQYITGLRRTFGEFLHKASVSLQQQGEENTVDAVHGLVGDQNYNPVSTGCSPYQRFGPSGHSC